MAKQNRDTLKKFFTDGALPTSTEFGVLIDSTLNMKDEGFTKSAKNGVEISSLGSSTGLMSFFRDSQPQTPLWSIHFDDNGQQNLIFKCNFAEGSGDSVTPESDNVDVAAGIEPTLTFSPAGWLGVHTDSPGCELDVNGTLRCATRLGTVPERMISEEDSDFPDANGMLVDQSTPVPADGKWHNITSSMSGCQAIEVVAGVGKKNTGRYALLHAVALNTFNPRGLFFNFWRWKNKIKHNQAYYRSRSDKLSLRWSGEQQSYFLQIQTNSDYGLDDQGQPIRINYHITKLWTDPRMARSWEVEAK
jgi:hypothetical protein